MNFTENNPDVVPFLDELPFWSAPFGLDLLERVKPGMHLNVLDVGTGTGFPLIELAMRLGKTCKFYGIDPSEAVLERARKKADFYGLNNVTFLNSKAEHTPFSASFFHLIVSNNGFNNVDNLELALKESYRIAAPRCQFLMTMNTAGTMIEFYRLFEEVLREEGLSDAVQKMKQHIATKRPEQFCIPLYRWFLHASAWLYSTGILGILERTGTIGKTEIGFQQNRTENK